MDKLQNLLVKQVFKNHVIINPLDNSRFLVYEIILNDTYLKIEEISEDGNLQIGRLKYEYAI